MSCDIISVVNCESDSFNLLPEELMLVIFKYLEPVEKLLPSLVCKSWNSILGIIPQTTSVLDHYFELPNCFLECASLRCRYSTVLLDKLLVRCKLLGTSTEANILATILRDLVQRSKSVTIEFGNALIQYGHPSMQAIYFKRKRTAPDVYQIYNKLL